MSAAKRKKSKHSKKKKSSKKISDVRAGVLSGDPRSQLFFKYIFSCLLLMYILCYLFKLFLSLGETFFWADENTHAYISSLIAENHKLPTRLPDDIYGGFVWSYPPLFHILAAGILSVAGFAALKYINLVLLLLFFICFYYLILKYYGQNEAVIACLLISLSPALAINSVRFMTDMLSMFLIFFSVFFFLRAIEKNNFLHAALSGLSTGLLLLSKQAGIIILSFYGLLLLWFLWKDKRNAMTMLCIISTAVVIYAPYLAWALYHKIHVFKFLSFFVGNTPEWVTLTVRSFRRYDSSLQEFGYLFFTGNGLIITISMLIPIYYMIKSRAKELPYNYIFALFIYLMAAIAVWHITNTRHTLLLLPVLTFLVGYATIKIIPNKATINIVVVLLFIASTYSVYKLPNYRQKYNASKELIKLTDVIKKDHASNGRTLVLYSFFTLTQTGKKVIWPHPSLNQVPIDLMKKQTALQLYGLFKKYQIDYILIDTRYILNADHFNGRTYPLHFMRNCEKLDKWGRLFLQSMSESRKFILLKVI